MAAPAIDAKLLKKVVKEGGKRGVELEGAGLGGMRWFTTYVKEADGDAELLLKCVEAMNVDCAEGSEERTGCSGHIAKLVLCDGVGRLALCAYVPEDLKSSLSPTDWLQHIFSMHPGNLIRETENMTIGEILCPEKSMPAIKLRDEIIPKSIAFLRSKGLFPDVDSDDDDDVVFGDDDFADL